MKSRARAYAIASISTFGIGVALFAGGSAGNIFHLQSPFASGWGALAFDPAGFATLFASLFAIMNPVVAVPLFVSMTESRSAEVRRKLAFVAAAAVFAALIVAAVFGERILSLFAIGIPSFRIAGGIIVLSMGLTMLRAEAAAGRKSIPKGAEAVNSDSQAICPLAIPLLAGPGAIATVILRCQAADQPCDYLTLAAAIAVMVVLVYATLRAAVPIARAMGRTGVMVVTRLVGMILAAIAIDMAVIGVKGAFPEIF